MTLINRSLSHLSTPGIALFSMAFYKLFGPIEFLLDSPNALLLHSHDYWIIRPNHSKSLSQLQAVLASHNQVCGFSWLSLHTQQSEGHCFLISKDTSERIQLNSLASIDWFCSILQAVIETLQCFPQDTNPIINESMFFKVLAVGKVVYFHCPQPATEPCGNPVSCILKFVEQKFAQKADIGLRLLISKMKKCSTLTQLADEVVYFQTIYGMRNKRHSRCKQKGRQGLATKPIISFKNRNRSYRKNTKDSLASDKQLSENTALDKREIPFKVCLLKKKTDSFNLSDQTRNHSRKVNSISLHGLSSKKSQSSSSLTTSLRKTSKSSSSVKQTLRKNNKPKMFSTQSTHMTLNNTKTSLWVSQNQLKRLNSRNFQFTNQQTSNQKTDKQIFYSRSSFGKQMTINQEEINLCDRLNQSLGRFKERFNKKVNASEQPLPQTIEKINQPIKKDLPLPIPSLLHTIEQLDDQASVKNIEKQNRPEPSHKPRKIQVPDEDQIETVSLVTRKKESNTSSNMETSIKRSNNKQQSELTNSKTMRKKCSPLEIIENNLHKTFQDKLSRLEYIGTCVINTPKSLAELGNEQILWQVPCFLLYKQFYISRVNLVEKFQLDCQHVKNDKYATQIADLKIENQQMKESLSKLLKVSIKKLKKFEFDAKTSQEIKSCLNLDYSIPWHHKMDSMASNYLITLNELHENDSQHTLYYQIDFLDAYLIARMGQFDIEQRREIDQKRHTSEGKQLISNYYKRRMSQACQIINNGSSKGSR